MANPDELLADAREAARWWWDAEAYSNAERDAAVRLANAFNRLDDHMNDGGPPPADWTGAR
jgi:hypothetical protein